MTHQADRYANEAEMLPGGDAATGDGAGTSDRGSAPVDRDRTGEEQAAINRENDPPA
jgi:hypothetical protein